ncbi:MAG: hypothetical protein AAB870_04050 [Patescibacteria group bacterium]
MKDTRRYLFIITTLLVLVVVGIGVWCLVTPPQSFQKPIQEKPVKTNAVGKKDSIAIPQGNVYKNAEFGFEITLPDGVQNPPSTEEYIDPLTGKQQVQYGFDLFSVSVIKNISPEEFAEAISDNTQFGPKPKNIIVNGISAVYLEIGKASGDTWREYFFSKGENTIAVFFFGPKTSTAHEAIINSFTLGD